MVRKAYFHGNDILTLMEETQVDGLIICEKNVVKYCSPSAKKMLDLPEHDFIEKLSKKWFCKVGT